MATSRLSYRDSCVRLQQDYIDAESIPTLPDHLPRHDDEGPLGVSFFRTFVGEGDDLSNLTLPRTYFARSEIRDALFRNTDFTESHLCWNDFTDVDFTDALLIRSDLRASLFTRVNFNAADLTGADIRHSSFLECDFTDAQMAGVVITGEQSLALPLSDKQRAEITTADLGLEPGGG